MAHSKQAKKRLRQNVKQRLRNRLHLATMRTYHKQLVAAIAGGKKEEAQGLASLTLKRIDKAARFNVIHRNAAARKKRQVMNAVRAMS